VVLAAVSAGLVACGGDDGGLRASDEFHARCAVPRSGVDPATGEPYQDTKGSVDLEKRWLRSWIDETYLWYDEVPEVNPKSHPSPITYFGALKTRATTASGKPKDRFHFTIPTAEWVALSQSGVEVGYGAQWVLVEPAPPRHLVVAYSEPGSPAAAASIGRGTQILRVDGVDLVNGNDIDTLNAGLFPAQAGETHTFQILDPGATSPRTVTLTAASIESVPVRSVAAIPAAGGPVGYILFNDHIATAEAGLVAAIRELEEAGVTDLVLDLRYNGGGYLVIASQLAYMIAGPAATAGKTFERVVFNDKHPTINPVTGEPLEPYPFERETVGLSLDEGQPLPTLGLGRVYVLTGPGTCSASEAVMNGLRGIDLEVIQIGTTTCGKPYGFYATDNCGTTYFAIQMQGMNHKGFGDYGDGFTPAGSPPTGVPGCLVGDDYGRELGDPAEQRLAAALRHRAGEGCTPGGALALARGPAAQALAKDGQPLKSPWRQNRILGR
jgi:carboxyl-terminal processing protease